MGRDHFIEWFSGTGVRLDIRTTVFVPPEFVNLLGAKLGKLLLRSTDWCAQAIGFINSGGLIVVREKRQISRQMRQSGALAWSHLL